MAVSPFESTVALARPYEDKDVRNIFINDMNMYICDDYDKIVYDYVITNDKSGGSRREIIARHIGTNAIVPIQICRDENGAPTTFFHPICNSQKILVRIVAFAKMNSSTLKFRSPSGIEITLHKTVDVPLYLKSGDPESVEYIRRNHMPAPTSEEGDRAEKPKPKPIISCFVWNMEIVPMEFPEEPFYRPTDAMSEASNAF